MSVRSFFSKDSGTCACACMYMYMYMYANQYAWIKVISVDLENVVIMIFIALLV